MPEVTVRKRVGKRSGGVKYKTHRWFYRNRPMVAVVAAFAIATLAAIVAVGAGVGSMNDRAPDDDAAAAAPAQ